MQLEGIDHVALGVRDIERSVKWYTEVLGFSDFMKACGTACRLLLAKEILELRCSLRARMQN